MIVNSLNNEKTYPDANCQWCGDTGEFEDTEGQIWHCLNGCKPNGNYQSLREERT